MNDKESGKRKTKSTDKAEYAQIEIGDHVDLFTRDKSKATGNGVVIKIDQMYSETPKAGTPRANENKVITSYSETPKAGTPKTCEKMRASSSGTPKASENKVSSPKLSKNEKEATLHQESDIIYEEKDEVGIFEWDRGELFLGMFKENGDYR